jgi:hypothetical protein
MKYKHIKYKNMSNIGFGVLLTGLMICSYLFYPVDKGGKSNSSLPETTVFFETSNNKLQALYDAAESKALVNINRFEDYSVLVEGGNYRYVWLETQPMGGYMYGKRNLEIARNNIRIFLDFQRKDGRFPGMITNNVNSFFPGLVVSDTTNLNPVFGWFQGYCMPMPAFELYYWLKKDRDYLQQLYNAFEKFDNYLWKTRDSNKNGCLETWCVFDTGEDHSTRFGESPYSWPFEMPPGKKFIQGMSEEEINKSFYEKKTFDFSKDFPVPIESMDIMSYSYTGRDVLSLISKELENGKEEYWRAKANEVRAKLKEYLWDNQRHACFDRDKQGKVMDILVHNNLRCMYYGSFDQEMADRFIRYHLLNPEEFWTPMPLPSIAVNNPYFRNNPKNDWSGQPQSLTFQRSIRALENYGHYAELTMIGKKYLDTVGDSLKFVQQFDPFTGIISTEHQNDGYGPAILATLEFISRLYGIHMSQDKIYWSCLDDSNHFIYSQKWGNKTFRLETNGNQAVCFINDIEVFSFTKGVRIVSDINGNLKGIIGIETKDIEAQVKYNGKTSTVSVQPNTEYNFNGKFNLDKSVEFSNGS